MYIPFLNPPRLSINLIVLLFVLLSFDTKAQKSEVIKVLERYAIKADVLDNKAKENATTMAFDLKQTTAASSTEKLEVATYNGSQEEGKRWILKSVNGKQPSSRQTTSFLQAHPDHPPVAVVDDDSYKVVSDVDHMLIIEFAYLERNLIADNMFLKDCKGKLFINTETKLLERQEVENVNPLKIKGIKIIKLLTRSSFIYNENIKGYLTAKEVTNFIVQLLVLTSDSEITAEYANYKQL